MGCDVCELRESSSELDSIGESDQVDDESAAAPEENLPQAGHGSCKSFWCWCSGFSPQSKKPHYCTCGHHYKQHN